jgi:23S rRNA A2030 N6-methylase RlmJ
MPNYTHDKYIAGHGDVLKHVVLIHVIAELQKEHPEGLLVVDAFCGDGVYDLNAHENAIAYQKGILKVLEQRVGAPAPVQHYIELVLKTTGCSNADNLDVYPGSPVLVQNVLRMGIDEHRLLDKNVEEVQWLKAEGQFQQRDAFESMEFILPYTDGGKHPVIFLDPDYQDDSDYGNVKKLTATIVDQHPYATIVLWMPYIQNHPFRWSFPTGMRELAKTACKSGRYFCHTTVAKDEFQGSCVLVCNPTRDLDDILDDTCIHWLANTMNLGKDEFSVEQTNKKQKSKA